jgi:hypothetical protein
MTQGCALAPLALAVLGACASAPGIDRPVPLDPAYAAREAGAGKPADRCGPEFISDNLPKSVVSAMGPLLDGPFRPVCARHDACYELREQTQAWCDQRMRTEMVGICNAGRREDSLGAALCRVRAGLYFGMVDNSYGAYSYHGEAGGRIVSLDTAGAPDGEIRFCVTAENTTPLMQEYVIDLRAANGRRIDREPGFREYNVRAGSSIIICAGTEGSPFWNLSRIKGPVTVRLLADNPDSIALGEPLTVIDERVIAVSAFAGD